MTDKLKKHRVLLLVFGLVLAPTALVLSYRWGQYLHQTTIVSAAPSKHAAFTLYLTEIIRKGPQRDGPGKVSSQQIIAQRSDGSRVEITTHHPGTKLEYRLREILMADATFVRGWDAVRLKATGKPQNPGQMQAIHAANRILPESGCTTNAAGKSVQPKSYKKGATSAIHGIAAIQFVKNESPTTETWFAPALDCQSVYRLAVFSDDSGKVTDTSERMLISYSLAEPDPALFDVSSFEESSVIEAHEKNFRKAGFPEAFIQKVIGEMRNAGKENEHN